MKTPKEKADEIIDKHYWIFGDGYLGHQHIQHALLEVDGILESIEIGFEDYKSLAKNSYYEEVKTEINNL